MRISDWSSDVCSSDLVAHVLSSGIVRLEPDARIMRCLFGLFGALAQVGGVAEAEDFAGKFSERAVDLIFGPLNGEHVHKIQRGSVELFEHLVAGAPLSQEALADLKEDLDAKIGREHVRTQVTHEHL